MRCWISRWFQTGGRQVRKAEVTAARPGWRPLFPQPAGIFQKICNLHAIISEMDRFRDFMEWQAFGVCTAIGDKIGIATSRIRMWFIYISFLTMGSPLIIYMVMAFWLNMKKYILYSRRNPIWYW
jgi:phage shock protein PspC (stress-responsive transcriptional regulator)